MMIPRPKSSVSDPTAWFPPQHRLHEGPVSAPTPSRCNYISAQEGSLQYTSSFRVPRLLEDSALGPRRVLPPPFAPFSLHPTPTSPRTRSSDASLRLPLSVHLCPQARARGWGAAGRVAKRVHSQDRLHKATGCGRRLLCYWPQPWGPPDGSPRGSSTGQK